MRENNPFEDTSAPDDGSKTADQASANALDALKEPKKSSGFLGALMNRKKPSESPVASTETPAASAADFSGSDSSFQPLINETPPGTAVPAAEPPTPTNVSDTFKKTPPVAIDGVSPDYNAPVSTQPTAQPTTQPVVATYEQPAPTAPQYEDLPQAESPYTTPPEQPMIYQQPAAQDYYQPQPDPYLTNQPLPVNYNTAPNMYDPYNPYATMVDLNPNAPDPAKKPDWKFVITFS
ncbi:MAG: hypothetical protein LBU20_01305, partial [Candidatus Nomurabacteria bacterium]|nr:hypothetical protein [Candidatus Nomurabacteria bacterium]